MSPVHRRPLPNGVTVEYSRKAKLEAVEPSASGWVCRGVTRAGMIWHRQSEHFKARTVCGLQCIAWVWAPEPHPRGTRCSSCERMKGAHTA